MIYWAPFLHFYQPSIQYHHILKKVCNECYRPLLKMFLDHPKAKVTINMCGILTEQLSDHGMGDVIDNIKELAENKQLEFVDSAKHHPILPLIPQKEVHRQIKLNQASNRYFFGKSYKPRGFFPPEMCYSASLGRTLENMGYEWALISGVACQDKWPLDFISAISRGSKALKIFYRDDILSNKISFRSLDSIGFLQELVKLAKEKEKEKKDIYVITAMDAETFGHHIQHWEHLFLAQLYETIDTLETIHHHYDGTKKKELPDSQKKIFADLKEMPHIKAVTISELLDKFPVEKTKLPKPSSWSTTKDDIARKNYYPLWKDINNHIHDLQWEHLSICFELVNHAVSRKDTNKESKSFVAMARWLLDYATHSCQFWWANKTRGMWEINLIHKGLLLQEEVLLNANKAISISSIDTRKKKLFYHEAAAARDIANKIRDLLISG
jgi:alpha-amylase/alpha-mannosidase (GH57 family)